MVEEINKMKKKLVFSAKIFLSGLLIIGPSLGTKAFENKVISGKAGPILHKVQLYSIFSEIPATWTITKFKRIAKAKPAPSGYTWYVLS